MKMLTLAAALLAAAPAFAASTVVDFEGVTSFASIQDYYNGGTDSAGASGPDLGVSFTDAALGLSNDVATTFFSHAPSPLGVMIASDATATMNVAAGFSGDLAFWYSALTPALDVVKIYSGLNGSGTLLGAISLSQNATLGCNDSPVCNFQRISLSFAGTAHSAVFGGNFGNVAFDDVTISTVPEPASALLMALGGCGLLLAARRRG
jgi:hypothetical protein